MLHQEQVNQENCPQGNACKQGIGNKMVSLCHCLTSTFWYDPIIAFFPGKCIRRGIRISSGPIKKQ